MEILLRLGSLFGLLLPLAGLWPILFGQQTLFEVLKKFLTWLDAARKKVVALNSIHLVLLIVGVVILTTVNIPVFTSFLNPSKPTQPGGVWLSPNSNGLVIKHLAHFAARSYPSNRADPPIDHIEFRAFWAGLHYWKTACAPYTLLIPTNRERGLSKPKRKRIIL